MSATSRLCRARVASWTGKSPRPTCTTCCGHLVPAGRVDDDAARKLLSWNLGFTSRVCHFPNHIIIFLTEVYINKQTSLWIYPVYMRGGRSERGGLLDHVDWTLSAATMRCNDVIVYISTASSSRIIAAACSLPSIVCIQVVRCNRRPNHSYYHALRRLRRGWRRGLCCSRFACTPT